MADKKISDFTAATTLAAGDFLEIENAGGNSRKITAADVRKYMTGYEGGPPGSVPTVASLTWVNQGTTVATDVTDGIRLDADCDGEIHILKVAAPSAPFDVYLRAEMLSGSVAAVTNILQSTVAIVLRDGVNGDFLNVGISEFRTVSADDIHLYLAGVDYWTNATTFSSSPLAAYQTKPHAWLRVNVTSTTVTVYVSPDGRNWLQVGTETIATRVGAVTEYGLSIRANANNAPCVALVSYFSTTAPV